MNEVMGVEFRECRIDPRKDRPVAGGTEEFVGA